jgi:hypothetical protein
MLAADSIRRLNFEASEFAVRELRLLGLYDPETGLFSKPATTYPSKAGYLSVSFMGHMWRAHRLAWRISHGHWPDHEIDHINGMKDDNRLANLRDVTHSENMRNDNTRIRMTTRGYCMFRGKFRVRIGDKHIGMFATEAEALAARAAAIAELRSGL